MKQKTFHRGRYDGTANIIIEDCTECGEKTVPVMCFIAEHNAGELYTVEICKNCLQQAIKELEEMK
jgi:hypothetical protein